MITPYNADGSVDYETVKNIIGSYLRFVNRAKYFILRLRKEYVTRKPNGNCITNYSRNCIEQMKLLSDHFTNMLGIK